MLFELIFIFFGALWLSELSETEVKMSEKTEKLVHIIMPDLLNYLEMVESGEIIEKRIEKNKLLVKKEKEHNAVIDVNQKVTKNR